MMFDVAFLIIINDTSVNGNNNVPILAKQKQQFTVNARNLKNDYDTDVLKCATGTWLRFCLYQGKRKTVTAVLGRMVAEGDRFVNKFEDIYTKQLRTVKRREEKMERAASGKSSFVIKRKIEDAIPPKVLQGLEIAFGRAFQIIFNQGTSIIEISINQSEIENNRKIQEYVIDVRGTPKELRKFKQAVTKSNLVNTAITTVEGIGLGALGIGLPDIVLFVALLFRGIYATFLRYGFAYDTTEEKLLILKMMETALSKGKAWKYNNDFINEVLSSEGTVELPDIKAQTAKTASALATNMLILKFIQGVPIVGSIGGAFNPIYYHKIMRYVELKCEQRYLLEHIAKKQGSMPNKEK